MCVGMYRSPSASIRLDPLCFRREQSKSLLDNKPDGTFLVRPKENYNNELPTTTQEPIHCYTIDIM